MGPFARQRQRAAQALAAEYQAEGVLYAGVCGGSLTLRNFRCPGLRSGWDKTSMRFTLLLTESRMWLRAFDNRYPAPIDPRGRIRASRNSRSPLMTRGNSDWNSRRSLPLGQLGVRGGHSQTRRRGRGRRADRAAAQLMAWPRAAVMRCGVAALVLLSACRRNVLLSPGLERTRFGEALDRFDLCVVLGDAL